ncbi:MAG: single-stranded DNA-binding protein [Oscillospiraceae bacterium]
MNVVCLVGRLIADPELRQTPTGTSVCSFVISVNRSTKGDDGYYKSDLIRCIAWRQGGEFVSKYFKKGQMIGVNGAIQTNQYQDKDTGKKITAFEVLVNNTYFVEGKGGAAQGTSTVHDTPKMGNNNPSSFSTGDLDGFSAVASDDGDLPF